MLRCAFTKSLSLASLGLVLLPAALYAQSGLSGVVKDTSGAVMPGVTIEASSPALIERTRSVVSDTQGRYAIIDLRPGVYKVTFGLEGFRSVIQESIDLLRTSRLP